MDRAPVTNERYAAFVRDTGHRAPRYWPGGAYPRELAGHPVVGVDYFDAIAFALWAGGTLPTELEWVEATGLPEHRTWAWGDDWDSACCNAAPNGIGTTSPVGAHPKGNAPSGCVDMCGNVWEMTCSTHPGDDRSVIVKGGSWYDSPEHAQIDARYRVGVNKRLNTVGFRLIYGRPPRFPEFVDAHVAARGIGERQAGEDAAPETELDQFQVAFAELQAELRDSVADLDLSAFDSHLEAVEQALAMLDQPGESTAVPTAVRKSAPPPPAPTPTTTATTSAPTTTTAAKTAATKTAAATAPTPTSAPTTTAPKTAAAPTAPPSWSAGLKAGLRHLRQADLWGRIRPAYRALRSRRPERTMWQRIRAALHAFRRAKKGARLRDAFGAVRASDRERTLATRVLEAARELWRPRGGPRLWASLRAAVAELALASAVRRGLASVPGAAKWRPRLLIAALILAFVALVYFAGTSVIEAPWLQRVRQADTEETVPGDAQPEPEKSVWTDAAATPFTPGASRIDDELAKIAEGSPEVREEAERYLISRRDASYPRVRKALQADLTPGARASLRYVLVSIEELRSRHSVRAQVLRDPPRRGLLVFCRRFGPRTTEAIHTARRTGKAEGLPVTVVLIKGNERTMSAQARHLRNSRVFLDRQGYLAQRLRVTHTPAIVGLDRDGRRQFLLDDPISRARLAYDVARIKR